MVRVKRRYILFEIVPNDPKLADRLPIGEKDIIAGVRESVQTLFGDFGVASIVQAFQLKRFNTGSRTGVLMCKRGNHRLVLSALPFVRRVRQCECVVNTLHVSGTIRGCLRRLRVHHSRQISELRKQLTGVRRAQQIEAGLKLIEQSLTPTVRMATDEV